MSKQRAKGTRVENQAVEVFQPWFRYCERRALRGKNDAGDLCGLPIPVEVKAGAGQLSDAMREAKAVAARFGVPGRYAAYVHARGKPPAEAYFVLPAAFGAEVLAAWDKHTPISPGEHDAIDALYEEGAA